MNMQGIVALILALTVFVILVSASDLSLLWTDAEDVIRLREAEPEDLHQTYRDIMNFIIGALAGFIAGHAKSK